MVPQPKLGVPGEHTKPYGSPSVLFPAPGSPGPQGSGAHQPAPHTPALTSSPSLHLSAIPGGWSTVPAAQCRVPCPPALCHAGCGTSTSVLQSTVTASWAEGRDTERDVTGGVHTSPPQASPSLQEPGGCARQVAPLYLPAG